MNDPLDFSHFEQQAAQQSQRTNLNLRFHIQPVENKAKSLEAGRPIFDNIEMVGINVPGSKDEVVKKVNDEIKGKYGPQYEYWRRTQEQPVDGTPLSMVPFLNPGQIAEMRAINIHTLEQLQSLSDTAVQKIGMGGMELRKKAQAYVKSGSDNAAMQKLITENENLRRDLTQAQSALTAANARYEQALQGLPPQPPANGVDIQALIAAEIAKQIKGAA